MKRAAGLCTAVLVLAAALTSPTADSTPRTRPDGPMIIAHRGGTGDLPENTLLAITNAVTEGVDGLWLTVQASSDRVPVLFRPTDLSSLTNVLGPLWLMRAALPALTESRGFIANISAVVAEQPLAGMAAYAASKAALTAADRALARELRAAGISVTDARPPHTETGLADRPIAGTAPRLSEGLQPEAVARRIVAAITAGEREIPAEAFTA